VVETLLDSSVILNRFYATRYCLAQLLVAAGGPTKPYDRAGEAKVGKAGPEYPRTRTVEPPMGSLIVEDTQQLGPITPVDNMAHSFGLIAVIYQFVAYNVESYLK
jgi:hypothetical protein